MYNHNLLTSHGALRQVNEDHDSVLISKRAWPGSSNKLFINCSNFPRHIGCPPARSSTTKVTSSKSSKTTTTTSRALAMTSKTIPASSATMRPTSVHSAVTTSTVSVQPPSLPSTPVANGNNFGSSSTFTPSESISLSSLSSISSPIASHSDPESSAPHQSSSSYSVITFSTTNENGYTIDVTSTSFFMPLSTNSASKGGSINNAKTDSTSAASKGANVRAIVGGIVGAITFILLLLFAIWTIRRRKKNRMAPSSEFIRSYGTPFGSGSESRFRHLDDSTYDADAQSISNFPFETALSHGTQESYRSYFHQTREKSDIN